MRTTLNLDDDVLVAAKEQARREGRSVGAVVSGLVRDALNGSFADHNSEAFHGFHPLPRRGPVVSNAVIDMLREDEAE